MSRDCLKYAVKITPREDGRFSGEVPDLGSCYAEGATAEECLENLKGSVELWLATAKEVGVEPPSGELDEYSGNFALRMPKSLHRELATTAREQGISLNQLINLFLSSHLTTFRISAEFAQGSQQLRQRFADLNRELRRAASTMRFPEWQPSIERRYADAARSAA